MKRSVLFYRPFKGWRIASVFFHALFLFYFAVCWWGDDLITRIGFLLVGALFWIGGFLFYQKSRELWSFEQDGIRVFRCGKGRCDYASWESLSYAYSVVYSYKKMQSIVLSSCPLNEKSQKRYARRLKTVFLSQHSCILVLPVYCGMHSMQDRANLEQIKALIQEKVGPGNYMLVCR